ncbi:MAG TPA: hypothetical protein VF824_15900 [Thermoanaerobaculia bacterium]|jgi:hypothetical protein
MISELAAARQIAADAITLLDAAYGCRAGNLNPVTCAPILLAQFPGTSATDMAVAFSLAWAGIINNSVMTAALTAAGYSATDVAAAVAAALHLLWLDNATYANPDLPNMPKVHALYQGDLTRLSLGETVDFLVVSCLPGDYTPTPATLIGALNNIGVSVQQLSQNPAATYAQYNCWVSQPVSGQSFSQLIVFQSTGQDAAANLPGIFSTVEAYFPTPHPGTNYPYANVAMPLVSTGSAGADPTAVLTAIFNSAKSTLSGSYPLGCLRTVVYSSTLAQQMLTVFQQLVGSGDSTHDHHLSQQRER